MDGRGRWVRWEKRDTEDAKLRLSIGFVLSLGRGWGQRWSTTVEWSRAKQKVGAIEVDVLPGWRVYLNYNFRGEPISESVQIDFTAQHFGGRRAWWVCPACGRRCGILYGGPRFLCRKCAGVDYYAIQQNGDATGPIETRLRRIRRRLGVTDGASHEKIPPRRRYMHHDTYQRLVSEYQDLQEQWGYVWTEQLMALANLFD
jgi:hypothetical protein